ncbi:polysaccharide deacetylase family protein [Calidifontibacillus oryziterrae]|uniref:polysaccharide deacetylase family protein n=1 Tax=Calidifontibacillus oryziterrae TaxID=1191699 RepID=UPI0002DB9003|nr:polysaccharide deacetylase family protein [Calidifontibacillus oryziterrae]
MKRLAIQLVAYSFILIMTFGFIQNPYTSDYVNGLKQSAITVAKQNDPLYLEIETKAKQYEVPPQDAQIHRVWKAMPGLNGLTVDIDESYQKMRKEGGFNPKKLVYKEVSPKITLNDLPPAPIYRGHPEKRMVSFLINVAWGNEYIPSMLKILEKHGVTATFFLEGQWVKKYPDVAKMIVDAGHELGNHAYSHPDMKKLTSQSIREEIVKTNEIIKATTGITPVWFGPPSGSFKEEVVKIAAEEKMKVVMWTADTVDWKNPNPTEMVNRVAGKVFAGAMILMHPTASTAAGLENLILIMKEKEYQIGNVSTLLSEERIK